MEIAIKTNVLATNDQLAAQNKDIFHRAGITALNIMGSPGAGKTTLLERTLERLKGQLRVGVIEGDIYTAKDAERIEAHGVPVYQINTGGACHLDAQMVQKALPHFNLAQLDLMVIENVGNLVCPVEFSLGEEYKVVVLSIIEGDDKPLKYPLIFKESTAAVLNKMDLLDFCDVNLVNLKRDILSINPEIKIFEVSSRQQTGLEQWVEWLHTIGKKSG
ncbi:MAG: hydrogenase nickel incorporation protein HypB [Clostridia bacterium]|nr:hydrogenase nickel incorporation protein HypB [Clostridia bacterium]